jgi:uncharacterized protein (TIGR03435 family)
MRPALILITACAGFAQTAPSPLAFDAASVKPGNPSDLRGPTFQFNPGGALNITNGTLRDTIETAYSVRDFQISGGPAWLNSAKYNIVAKSAAGDAPNDVPATRLKVQTLLAQRFQLRIHRETRELPIYALIVGKSGSKLVEARPPAPDDPPAGIRAECGQITGTIASVANLAVYPGKTVTAPGRGPHRPFRQIQLSTRLDPRFVPMLSASRSRPIGRAIDLHRNRGKTWVETGID